MISPGLGGVAYGNSGLTDWGGARQAGSVPNHGTNGDDYVQDWEVGLASADFGQGTSTPVLDPNLSRPWSALTNIGIERELLPGLSTSFNYYRRDTQSAILLVNRAISLSDYTLFQFSNPCATAGTPRLRRLRLHDERQQRAGDAPGLRPESGSAGPDARPRLHQHQLEHGIRRRPTRVSRAASTPGCRTGPPSSARGLSSVTSSPAATRRTTPTSCSSADRSGTSPLTGQDVGAAYNVPWLNEFQAVGHGAAARRLPVQRDVPVVQPAGAARHHQLLRRQRVRPETAAATCGAACWRSATSATRCPARRSRRPAWRSRRVRSSR